MPKGDRIELKCACQYCVTIKYYPAWVRERPLRRISVFNLKGDGSPEGRAGWRWVVSGLVASM